jgi:RNA polymerase sigma factor (sigma-70 family)
MTWPTTHWGFLDAIRGGDSAKRSEALGEIVSIYGPGLVAFAGFESDLSRDDCEDVVQDFFYKCLTRDVLERADPKRGRFRNFLARTFKNFLLNWIRDRNAGIRMPVGGVVPLHELVDKHGRDIEPRSGESAEEAYERLVRASLFEYMLADFEKACRDAGQEKKYELYRRYEVEPGRDGGKTPSYAQLARDFDLPSEDAVGRVIRAAREEFSSRLLEKVAMDSESPAEAEVEYKLVVAAGLRN